MFFLKHLNPFRVYIIILVISSLILINASINFPTLNLIFYIFVHILIIYIGIYHFKKILYLVFFICGTIIDIFLTNEIGPHLITFMLLILFLSQLNKYFVLLSSLQLFLIITFALFSCLFFEMLILFFLFNYNFELKYLFKNILIFLLIFYPIFYFFGKIDRLR